MYKPKLNITKPITLSTDHAYEQRTSHSITNINQLLIYKRSTVFSVGWCRSVRIATGYGLDGPGIESRWGRDFPHLFRPALGPTQPPIQWVTFLSRG